MKGKQIRIQSHDWVLGELAAPFQSGPLSNWEVVQGIRGWAIRVWASGEGGQKISTCHFDAVCE